MPGESISALAPGHSLEVRYPWRELPHSHRDSSRVTLTTISREWSCRFLIGVVAECSTSSHPHRRGGGLPSVVRGAVARFRLHTGAVTSSSSSTKAARLRQRDPVWKSLDLGAAVVEGTDRRLAPASGQAGPPCKSLHRRPRNTEEGTTTEWTEDYRLAS